MSSRRGLVIATLACAAGEAFARIAAPATPAWPSKPLRLIVGYASGSSPDVQARLLAEPLSKALGQPVLVENKPGASGNIGADAVAKAIDGHTIGVVGNGPLTSSPYLYAKLPYDPNRDFTPIALIATAPLVWVTARTDSSRSAQQFIAYAQAEGDKLAYGSVGAGSGGHLGVELLKRAFRIDPLHVPFNGGPAVINALLGGQVQMALLPTSTVLPLVQAGKLDALAVSSAERSPLAPMLPGMRELSADAVDIEVWNALVAPATLLAAQAAHLSAALKAILETPALRDKLLSQGWQAADPSPQTLAQRIARDAASYRGVIENNQIKLD